MRPSSGIASKDVQHDPETLAAAWEFILEEQQALKRLCASMSRRDRILAEDMMSDVIPVYVPKAIACWDATKSSLRGHVMRSVRMYLWKYSNYRHAPGDGTLEDASGARRMRVEVEPVADLRDEVRHVLAQLPPYERSLLHMYHMCSLTHEEMADVLGVSKGTARVHYRRALELARHIAIPSAGYEIQARQTKSHDDDGVRDMREP